MLKGKVYLEGAGEMGKPTDGGGVGGGPQRDGNSDMRVLLKKRGYRARRNAAVTLGDQ